MTMAIKQPCFVVMSGSHFIVQTSKLLQIDVRAVTLSQGHGKFIQYISPDPYILCTKYLRFSWNGFDVGGKQKLLWGGGRSRRGENKPKAYSHPRPEWLNNWTWCIFSWGSNDVSCDKFRGANQINIFLQNCVFFIVFFPQQQIYENLKLSFGEEELMANVREEWIG